MPPPAIVSYTASYGWLGQLCSHSYLAIVSYTGLKKEVMEIKMEGKRGRGRKHLEMIDDLLVKECHGDLEEKGRRSAKMESSVPRPALT